MKKVKKILALVLAMTMALGMTLVSSAEGDSIIGNSDDEGTITVQGIEAEEGKSIVVKAYKIIEAKYENNGSFSGYDSLYKEDIPVADSNNITEDALASIATKINPNDGIPMDLANGTATATVGVGSYLVLITGAEAKVYNPVVVSVKYVNNAGGTIIEDGSVDVTKGVNIENGNAWVKVSNKPTIDKKIVKGNESVSGSSASIGDDIPYEVTIDPVPNYGGKYPVLSVTDTLSSGLTFNNNVVVKAYQKDNTTNSTTLVENTDYTVNTENGIKINFVVGGKYTLNSYTGGKVVISYSAKLNESAALNQSENTNTVKLDYARNSNIVGSGIPDTPDPGDEKKTYTYTFDIDGKANGSITDTTNIITKKGEEKNTANENQPLAGAGFKLYLQDPTNNANARVYRNNTGTFADDGTVTSDATGQIHIQGLGEGTYYLQEVSAPDDYSVNTHVFTIVIAANYNDNGTLKNWSVSVDNTPAASFTVNSDKTVTRDVNLTGATIQNTKLASLPSTGGIGTTIFTIGGVVLMVGAAGLFFATRKRSAK